MRPTNSLGSPVAERQSCTLKVVGSTPSGSQNGNWEMQAWVEHWLSTWPQARSQHMPRPGIEPGTFRSSV